MEKGNWGSRSVSWERRKSREKEKEWTGPEFDRYS